MAVTSKTSNGRAENPHPILADGDPFFHFMDFTFSDEELNDGKAFFEVDSADAPTHSIDHPAISVTNLDALPSPTPLAQILNFQYDAPPTGSSTISGIHQPKIAAAAVVSAERSVSITISKSSYDDDHRTTTNTFRPEDVLSIRGQGSSKHCGNSKFRDLVARKKRAYDRNACPDFRRSLAEDIIAQLLPGRFLKKTDTSQRFYQILDYNASVTKAMFAIRDVKAPPSKRATITGKRKRKASATSLAYHQSMTNVDDDDKGFVIIQSSEEQHDHPRPKRERRNEISITLTKQRLNVPTLPLHMLSPSEEDEVKTSIEQSTIAVSCGIRKMPECSRSMDIYYRIECIVSKGAEARKNLVAECVDPEWFSPSRQREVRLELLGRCKAAMLMGMSYDSFFDQLTKSLSF